MHPILLLALLPGGPRTKETNVTNNANPEGPPARRETPMPTEATDQERQHALEREMSALGTEKFRKALAAAREAGREDEVGGGHSLLARAVVAVSDGIKAYLKQTLLQPRAHRAPKFLRLLDEDTLALLAAKGVIRGLAQKRRLQNTAIGIGHLVEDEVKFRAFARAEAEWNGEMKPLKEYVKKTIKNLNSQTGDYAHKRKAMSATMAKKGIEWDEWSQDDLYHIGAKLIDIVITTTGVAKVSLIVNKKKTFSHLTVTPETLKWINDRSASMEVMCPLYQPMIVPPKDWTGPTDGGYLSPWGLAAKVVKTRNRAYIEELLVSNSHELVYSSLNTIQKTAWKVNTDILRVMKEAWESDSQIAGLPAREETPKPPKPDDIATNEESRRMWRRAASNTIKDNLKLGSKRLMVDSTIKIARKFQNEKAIYFPYNLDFRGRIYSIPSGMCPQGHDIGKSLLTFANGKPIEDQRAADWFAIHGANLWGFDKVSLEARVQWVKDNQHHIIGSSKNPLDYLWWAEADGGKKAWQFLAFCFEWAGFVAQGFGFVSSLPIALDGSCNGLQHFSAMLRDPIGGAAVNLIPSDKPNDIYQTVADTLIAKLKADGSAQAKQWLAFGITRKTTKRPVMVVPYGGTRHSGREYVIEHVKERLEVPGAVNPWGDDKAIFLACNFLSGFLWDSIRETVVAARDAMDWLQKVSQIVSKEEKPLNWTSPSGFKVQQAYPNVKKKRVKTMIAGMIVKLYLNEGLPTLDKRLQAQGISPNFVHSLDAAALTFTVDAAAACGIEAFAMIHDSYGTLAADTDTLRECLRQAFCQMYQTDVLQAFADEIQKGLPEGVKLPPLPKKGSLDINLVTQSDFFFA